jgi:hypothetical protein
VRITRLSCVDQTYVPSRGEFAAGGSAVTIQGAGHLRLVARPVPRRALLLVLAVMLLIAWGLVDTALWWLGLAALVLAIVGACQLLGYIPSV